MLKKNSAMLAKYKVFLPVFEGNGGEAGAGGSGGAAGAGGAGGAGGGGSEKAFTQEQVNSMIAQERKKLEEQHKAQDADRLTELKALQSKANLTKSERDNMATKIAELEKKVYSAEELAERERTKLLDEANAARAELTAERDAWRNRHNEAQIGRDISDAAIAADAINPRQIEAILRPMTSVVEEKTSEGVLTYVTRVNMQTTDAEGKPVTLVMTPKKAVESLKDNKEFFNLFKGKGTAGLGAGNAGGTPGQIDYKNMSVEQYAEQRKKGK